MIVCESREDAPLGRGEACKLEGTGPVRSGSKLVRGDTSGNDLHGFVGDNFVEQRMGALQLELDSQVVHLADASWRQICLYWRAVATSGCRVKPILERVNDIVGTKGF